MILMAVGMLINANHNGNDNNIYQDNYGIIWH